MAAGATGAAATAPGEDTGREAATARDRAATGLAAADADRAREAAPAHPAAIPAAAGGGSGLLFGGGGPGGGFGQSEGGGSGGGHAVGSSGGSGGGQTAGNGGDGGSSGYGGSAPPPVKHDHFGHRGEHGGPHKRPVAHTGQPKPRPPTPQPPGVNQPPVMSFGWYVQSPFSASSASAVADEDESAGRAPAVAVPGPAAAADRIRTRFRPRPDAAPPRAA